MLQIVKENLKGCINRTDIGTSTTKYWVIDTPIKETGICKEFDTEEAAKEYIKTLSSK